MRKAETLLHRSIKSYNRGNLLFAKIYYVILRVIFGCDILYTAQIDKSVQLVHNGLGCVFHPNVRIEKDCKIYQNVTLGGNGKIVEGKATNNGGPYLKDNVTVFAGACILGPVTVGRNSIVGANAVVIKDVPPDSIAVGVPATIKPKKSQYNFGD